MVKICVIGDPHGNLEKIKKIPLQNIDLIILTGDLGKADLMRKIAFQNIERQKKGLSKKEITNKDKEDAFLEAFNSTLDVINYLVKFAPVKTIFGNVEYSDKETIDLNKEIGKELPLLTQVLNSIEGVEVINNKILEFNGIKILGLNYFVDVNWVENFNPPNFDERMKNAQNETKIARQFLQKYSNSDIDIMVCHQPPFGVLDKVKGTNLPEGWNGKNAGSLLILDYISSKALLKYVFCGHIHEGEGEQKINNTLICNLGVCNYKIIEL